MAKKRTSAQQASLFKQEIPEMPEGYYSSGPNPNLRQFVEEHATEYDPETDDYNVPPFDQPIKTTKATAIYHMHTYWSKKPPSAIRQYIQHYTRPGDIVLDPLCGSGTSALAALMEGRAAIAVDLSPIATFIAKHYCTPIDVRELEEAFESLQARVKPQMDWLYETRCDRCDGKATTAFTVYSYVFQCSRCLEKVPLSDCVEAEGVTATGKPKTIAACPKCFERGHIEEISTTRNERFDRVPVMVSYVCQEGCGSRREERLHNDPDPKKRVFFERYDLGKLEEIESKEIPYWYPQHRMMNVESQTEPWGDKWRAGTSSFRTVAELFTTRNLWALAAYKQAIDSIESVDLRVLLTWVLLKSSKMMRYCSDGIGRITSGTYYVPQISRDSHVPSYIAEAFKDIRTHHAAKLEILPNRGVSPVILSTQDARDLQAITSDSVDYIFTDPPYAGKVQYGELNFVWEAWLEFDTHWHDREIIVNQTRGTTDEDWARMMLLAMSECYRVLKPGRWISLCYHDTSEGTWQLVQDLMTEIGFIPEQLESTLFILEFR